MSVLQIKAEGEGHGILYEVRSGSQRRERGKGEDRDETNSQMLPRGGVVDDDVVYGLQ